MELLASSHGEPWQAAMIGYLLSFYLMAFAALVAMPLAAFMRGAKRDP